MAARNGIMSRAQTPGGDIVDDPRAFLRSLFDSAIAAVSPAVVLPPRLPAAAVGRTIVVGAGKAAAAMARAVEDNWRGPLSGLVVTRYGHAVPCERIEVVEAGHPVPDAAGHDATVRILGQLGGLSADDLVLCLISGGGSSLLALPAGNVRLDDKQAINRALLCCGATIAEINCVRKHLSAVKGGRLAVSAYPARMMSFLISDVPRDDLSIIASGPTVADPTTYADALAVLEKYGIEPPSGVLEHLCAGAAGGAGAPDETPKPGDPRLERCETVVLATAADALAAAAVAARERGARPDVLGGDIEGEARDVGRDQADLALRRAREEQKPAAPVVLLSGGETTVTVRGGGRGGRNAEYLLGLALALGGRGGISALAADTDGIDGSEDNAGAFVMPDTLQRAAAAGLDPRGLLDDNDAYSFFQRLGDLYVTGPTRTNVNDFRAVLITFDDKGAGEQPGQTATIVKAARQEGADR